MSRQSFIDDHAAVVDEAGVWPLEGWTTVQVTGKDRASFLHNMCTNDIRALAPGSGCEAFFTDVKGKIVAHTLVLAGDDSIRLVAVPGQGAKLIPHLDRYIIREDVQLSDDTPRWRWLLLLGQRSTELLVRIQGAAAGLNSAWSHAPLDLGGIECLAVRCDLPWCGGWLLGCAEADASALAAQLRAAGTVNCSEQVWHAIRIESAWALYDVDFGEANLPQEVGRDGETIHFRKGCYLGQETVARIDALGHVNKRVTKVQFEGDGVPEAGAELRRNDQVVGVITSSCYSPRQRAPLALAMVRRGSNSPGDVLQCGDQAGRVL